MAARLVHFFQSLEPAAGAVVVEECDLWPLGAVLGLGVWKDVSFEDHFVRVGLVVNEERVVGRLGGCCCWYCWGSGYCCCWGYCCAGVKVFGGCTYGLPGPGGGG